MQFIRKRVLAGEVMLGVGANLGSSLTVEMIGAAGILLPNLDFLTLWIAKGFTSLVVGSDGGCVAGGLKSIADACSQYREG